MRFKIKLASINPSNFKPKFNENFIRNLNEILGISERAFPKGLLKYDDAKEIKPYEWKYGHEGVRVSDSRVMSIVDGIGIDEKMVFFCAGNDMRFSSAIPYGKHCVIVVDLIRWRSLESIKEKVLDYESAIKGIIPWFISHELGHIFGLEHPSRDPPSLCSSNCYMVPVHRYHGRPHPETGFCKTCTERLKEIVSDKGYSAYMAISGTEVRRETSS